jgi:hypothetical protein
MEREFLNILDWDLSIAEGDIMAHHEHLSSPTPPSSLVPVSLKRPRSQFQKDVRLGLEPSPFCPPPPPPNNGALLASKTRALTSSVTLPGFSSFLNNPHNLPPAPPLCSLQSSWPFLLSVTSGEERAHKRPRLVTHPPCPRQPLSVERRCWHPIPRPLQQSSDPRILNSLRINPFIIPYIPHVPFY